VLCGVCSVFLLLLCCLTWLLHARRCFADTLARMVPTGAPGIPATMTIAQCAQFAKDTSRTVFALQYGGECFVCECLFWCLGTATLAHQPSCLHLGA
jgi:hypothetical protein